MTTTPHGDLHTSTSAVDAMDTASDTHSDCIFCKIVKGEIPATKIYEDDETLAFLDIQPNNFGHTLVIPKDHFENIYGVPSELWCRVALTAQKIAIAVKNGLSADGVNIVMNNESGAGQLVMHAHVHIIPRENEDGFKPWPQKLYRDNAEMTDIAEKIRKSVE